MATKSTPEREPLETRVELHPFLAGLRPHHVKLLADCAMAKHFAADEYLFRQGEFANRFYLIEEGEIVLESLNAEGEPVVVERVGPGKLVGWSWLFPPYVWHFDARATRPTEAIFFYGTILREYCEREPSLGYELFKRMSVVMIERLQNARVQLLRAHGQLDRPSP
jgi:CRP-like cAMP-binding protein